MIPNRVHGICLCCSSSIQIFTVAGQQSHIGATPEKNLGPVVQSVVSLTSSLRVISLTVLADSIYNILIFLLKKM